MGALTIATLTIIGCFSLDPAFEAPPRLEGIASPYPGDRGISKYPSVIFFEDFERWDDNGTMPPEDTWTVRRNVHSETKVAPGRIILGGYTAPGSGVIEIACWYEGGPSTGGLYYKLGNYDSANEGLGNGYEDVYVRYY